MELLIAYLGVVHEKKTTSKVARELAASSEQHETRWWSSPRRSPSPATYASSPRRPASLHALPHIRPVTPRIADAVAEQGVDGWGNGGGDDEMRTLGGGGSHRKGRQPPTGSRATMMTSGSVRGARSVAEAETRDGGVGAEAHEGE